MSPAKLGLTVGITALVAAGSGLAYREHVRGALRADCPSAKRYAVSVDTKAHALALCEEGRAIATYSVRLGMAGVGKSREGDRKTPVGTYALSDPKPSMLYGTFVPVGYPNAAERAKGFTGSAIGIHGPDRRLTWLGEHVNLLDTTDGCIGLATDKDMDHVATWIRSRRVATITIR